MAQHDYTIANQTFPNTRTDLNNVFAAIVSQNSGATAPSTTYAYQLWYDTTTDILKMRNANDDAWIELFTIDQTADTASASGAGAAQGSNIIINGAMQVASRSTSVANVGGSSGYFTCDRWRVDTGNTAGRVTMSQASITDLPGFANALKLDVTTADTSIANNEVFRIGQRIEGQNLQQIAKGTASAKPLTLSFYVKGDAAATYVAQLKDADNTRSNTQNFSVTTSWTRVELTYVADTTGTLNDDNANSLEVMFWLHGGSDFTSGTFASNTWASETIANNYAGSNTSIFDSTDRELFITGVQLEVGETATDFDHSRSFGEELARCQRYFYRSQGTAAYTGHGMGANFDGDSSDLFVHFPVEMRANPSVSFSGTVGMHRGAGTSSNIINMTNAGNSKTVAFVRCDHGNVFSTGDAVYCINTNDASGEISFSAEL